MFASLRKLALSAVALFSKTLASNCALRVLMKDKSARPYPLSLWSPEQGPVQKGTSVSAADYTSWPSLVDRTFTGRHLPPRDIPDLPCISEVEKRLFRRSAENGFIASPRMSVLFALFAQWFTDSFLRTHPSDPRMNTSNHEIDLCQIYGLTESTAEILRSKSRGKLRCNDIKGGMFPEKLFDANGEVRGCFAKLPYLDQVQTLLEKAKTDLRIPIEERKPYLYATGLERGNTTIGYTSISTIFLREHNRLCDILATKHHDWNDDRLFQTARMINIACALKVIIEDYINALAGDLGKFKLVPGFADKQRWYRSNRISIEFNLLYRWHGLVPNTIKLADTDLRPTEFMYNNALIEKHGVEAVIKDISSQKAGAMVLHNTPEFLWPAELAGLDLSRRFKVQPYAEYCGLFGVKRPTSFEDLTGNEERAKELEDIYTGGVETVDFMVGLRAEKRPEDRVLGDLMLNMVGFDAFSQALTNPLLAENVYMRQTFSEVGFEIIEKTNSFRDIVNRNNRGGSSPTVPASFTA